MSRVHKYRAWDKINNRMWYSNEIGESENDLGFFNHFNEEGELDFILLGKDPYGEFNGYLKEFLPKMEFTGLLDKNKIEIYEKDLVKKCNCIALVVFKDGAFVIENSKNWHWKTRPVGHDSNKSIEVVGNRFENPEYLEE